MANSYQIESVNIRNEWESFIRNGVMPKAVRAPVLRSWIRCKKLGISPDGGQGSNVLSIVELNRCLKDNALLIGIVRDLLKDVCWSAKGSGYIFFLTDKHANLLFIAGDKRISREFEELINFGVGVNWGEDTVGTTAVSLALDENSPIFWMSEEKYCVLLKEKACASVPIKGKDGSVVGILGAATDLDGLIKSARPVFDFLLMAATAAQNYYQRFEIENVHDRIKKSLSLLLGEIPEGVLITDQGGMVVEVNHSFGSLLGLDVSEAIGKPVDSVFPQASWALGPDFINSVLSRKGGHKGRNQFNIEDLVSRRLAFKDASGLQEYSIHILQKKPEKSKTLSDSHPFKADVIFADIVGESREIIQAKRQALSMARAPYDVLIEGKTGTGKEMFAQAIHNASDRADLPFVSINCGAIPDELMESELFGYEGGAFTGARSQGTPGKLELADGGTLFLDEIGEMPLNLQVKLLRVVQEKQYMRLGGLRPIAANVRIICATNRDMESLVRTGVFRDDLFWRLNVLALRVPSLSERKSDIPVLIDYFLKQYSAERGTGYTLSDEADNLMRTYNWPGNVRELQNALKRAVVYSEGGVILPQHLPQHIIKNEGIQLEEEQEMPLQDAEKQVIFQAITSSGGNLSQAARLLVISRVTLYKKIKQYRLAR